MLTVEKLVGYLKDGSTQVSVKLEYSEDRKLIGKKGGWTHEYGVTISTRERRQNAWGYTSLHFHYARSQPGPQFQPDISAHFKTGKSKAAQQGHELKVWDAYALYLLLLMIKPVKDQWKPFKIHVTEQNVSALIGNKNLRALNTIFLSRVFDLSFWDSEAWSCFMDWQTRVWNVQPLKATAL